MGGFLGIGQSKSEKAGQGMLSNIFNFALPLAQTTSASGQGTTAAGLGTTGRGLNALSSPLNYFQRLLSGNRAAMSQAVAPEAAAARSASDAARRQLATSGTARGGGVASTNQQQQDQLRAQIDNLLFGARPAAAKGAADIGTTVAQTGLSTAEVGNQQLAAALQALGIGGGAAGAQYTGALSKESMQTKGITDLISAFV